jgi:hypothetical protein
MNVTANNLQNGEFMMNKKLNIPGTPEAWEDGTLGKSDAHVRKTSSEVEGQIDEALGLQAISIRLPRATIEVYKNLAEMHGVGYQPLMRDAICRWAESELKMHLAGAVQSQRTMTKKKSVKVTAPEGHEQTPMKKVA